MIKQNPNTFAALYRAVLTRRDMARDPKNRKLIAKAIAPANYLNQPVTVLEQVLTGKFADGLGNVKNVPDRIDFDPFPWQPLAVWILTQMKRWGYIKGDVDYKKIAEQVFLLTDAKKQHEGGRTRDARRQPTRSITVMGKEFDPAKPEPYVESFAIRQGLSDDAERCARRAQSSLLSLAAARRAPLRLAPRDAAGQRARRPAARRAIEYAKLMGKDRRATAKTDGLPDARRSSARRSSEALAHPFYDNGPNDKGIGIQLAYSLGASALGFLLAALVAIPLGFLIGMSPLVHRALDPFIQVLKPISPLAWMPLALYTIKDSAISAIFVIFICSVWPMLINTALRRRLGAARLAERRADAGGEAAAQGASR